MDYFLIILVFLSSISFMGFALLYFTSKQRKIEFERFNLKKYGLYIVFLEFFGGICLIIGLFYTPLLLLSSGGLALLMFFGMLTRIKSKDKISDILPAIFLMFINAIIFILGNN